MSPTEEYTILTNCVLRKNSFHMCEMSVLTSHRFRKAPSVAAIGRIQSQFPEGHKSITGTNVITSSERYEARSEKSIGRYRSLAWETYQGSHLVAVSVDSVTSVFSSALDGGLVHSHDYRVNDDSVDGTKLSIGQPHANYPFCLVKILATLFRDLF
ncbi:hypothetical protein ACOME3_007291 [Neoechinorhynchus agilis]